MEKERENSHVRTNKRKGTERLGGVGCAQGPVQSRKHSADPGWP